MSNNKPSSIHADWGVKLLTDLHSFFAKQTAKNYPTEQLLTYLAGIDDAPWTTFDQGKTITARHLARLLQPYGIVPKTIRLSTTDTPKGYKVADFKNAFVRYLADVADNVADNVADVADNVDDSIDVLDNVADVADNVAANVADKSGDVAANPLDATRNQLYRLGEHLKLRYEETGHPFSHASQSEVQQWRDLADLMHKAADSIDSFTVKRRHTVTMIKGNVAADVAAVRAADKEAVSADRKPEVAAPVHPPVQAKRWPPPKGWVWNHQTECYEPPKSQVQPDPPGHSLGNFSRSDGTVPHHGPAQATLHGQSAIDSPSVATGTVPRPCGRCAPGAHAGSSPNRAH